MRIQLILAPPITKHKEGDLNERIAPPLGILYIAAYVRDIAEVKVIDDNRERLPMEVLETRMNRWLAEQLRQKNDSP